MEPNETIDNYKFENSYTNKFGFKIKSYAICYSNTDKKIYMKEEITKSCLKIYDKIKN